MAWISVKDKLPDSLTIAIVYNEKGFMRGAIRAMYHSDYDCWVLYDPDYREGITLEVSHYIPIPNPPKSEE